MISSRLLQFLQHIYPKFVKQQDTKQEQHHVISLQFCGKLQNKLLNIRNANAMSANGFKNKLDRSLLNTSNDAIEVVRTVKSIVAHTSYNLTFDICGAATPHDVQQLAQQVATMPALQSLIIFWSGHGNRFATKQATSALYLSMANANGTEEVPWAFSQLVDLFQSTNCIKLYILECCHSGLALESVPANALLLASCSAHEQSGAWILDGSDSGGIMTKCLVDPIGTYFKIQYHVFYELGDALYAELLCIFDKYARQIAMTYELQHWQHIEHHYPAHISTLFLRFLLLVQYGAKLHVPQTAISKPSLDKVKNAHEWLDMENAIMSCVEVFMFSTPMQ